MSDHAIPTKPRKKADKDKWALTIPALLVVCVGFYLAVSFMRPAPPDNITIVAGHEDGAYTHFAKKYAEYMKKQGIQLHIVQSQGSVENLALLSDPDKNIDIAFVQSGVASTKKFPGLSGVASIYHEPMWVFLGKDSAVEILSDLHGKRIGTGRQGSGSYPAAMMILGDNGINTDNTQIVKNDENILADKLIAGELDAVIIVASYQAELISRMSLHPDLRLLDMQRAEAYVRRHPMFSQVLLPRGVISPADDIPAQDIHLISPVATLVVNNDLHPALVSLLLQAADHVHGQASVFDAAGEFPSDEFLDFPLADRAKRYFKNGPPFLQRYMPFWAAIMIDRAIILLLPLLTLMIPLVKVIPPVYRWRVRSRIYSWYEQLLAIEEETTIDTPDEAINRRLAALGAMEKEVNEIHVPLSYADAKYNLRLHIELVREQLQDKLST